MEHSFACLDHQHFLKNNEIVRLSRGLISLFDTQVDNRVKININPIQTGLFWSICDWGGGSSNPPPSVSLEPIMLGS